MDRCKNQTAHNVVHHQQTVLNSTVSSNNTLSAFVICLDTVQACVSAIRHVPFSTFHLNYLSIYLSIYGSAVIVNLGRFLQFLDLLHNR
jgi:hypothetical protein